MAQEKEKKKERRPSALKRDIQGEKRRLANRSFKASVSTAVRNFTSTIGKGDAEASKENLGALYSLIDKGVKTGVFKQNKANRDKARFAQALSK